MTSAFQLASAYVDEACSIDPVLCTQLGIHGSDGEWGESFGPAGLAASLALDERYRRLVQPFLDASDYRERLAARVMLASFDETKTAFDAGDHLRDLRHMASPLHQIRLVFDVMAVDTPQARADVTRRLETVGVPLGDYRRMLEMGLEQDEVVASRQVRTVIDQLRRMSSDPSSIGAIVTRVTAAGGEGEEITTAAEAARVAFGDLADWLEVRYLPRASHTDGVGRESYERAADRLVGVQVDAGEAYEWGWEEFRRLLSEMESLAGAIVPGAGLEEAKAYLESDPSVTAAGTDALLEFVSSTLDEALADLAGSHFEVPDSIRPLTVQLAPPDSPLGVYYRRPSEDFSRPGGIWYSIGGQEVFPLYQHVSTAYHEGFPGHHLQIATAMHRREEISRFQRLLTWCPGFGEGWGMYAEVLMGELGYLENPQHRFGMLAKQMYRTARILVDIGLHLGLHTDESSPMAPGSKWDFDLAVEFMRVYGFRHPRTGQRRGAQVSGLARAGNRLQARGERAARDQVGCEAAARRTIRSEGVPRNRPEPRDHAPGLVETAGLDGARLMRDAAVKRWSRRHALIYRASRGILGRRLVNNPMLLLTTWGHRTGSEHTVPLLYLEDPPRLVVIASYGGRPDHPTWYRNLLTTPRVRVQIGSARQEMTARTATAEERALWWPRAVAAYDGYREYQSRTDREIPIVFLEPVE